VAVVTGEPIIRAEGLFRSFGEVHALQGVDFSVEPGTVFGLLGPNGAGKTTAVRILTTLLRPDQGRATVNSFDVVDEPAEVRASIGLAGQFAAIDATLTGFENIEMVGLLYHMPRRLARRRADELLERFELAAAGHRKAGTYSGGMRRRLDLAASLVGQPPVLFLDEPTTGLDPRSRVGLWEVIKELVREGTTLLLTTQYLEEADQLADRIVVIDRGVVIAGGTADELKAHVGGDQLEFRVGPENAPTVAGLLVAVGSGGAQVDNETGIVTVPVGDDSSKTLTDIVRLLDSNGVGFHDLALRRPTLDDVFMTLTGHSAEEETPANGERPGRRRRFGRRPREEVST
jgi:ABC-2 type transport system ATP-binding protein